MTIMGKSTLPSKIEGDIWGDHVVEVVLIKKDYIYKIIVIIKIHKLVFDPFYCQHSKHYFVTGISYLGWLLKFFI